jgi:hypothetical protein
MIYLISLIILLLTVAGFYFPYVLLRPYLKSKNGRNLVLKGFLILAVLSGIMYAVVNYLQSTPAYFEQGIEQLHANVYIKDFNSYSYHGDKLQEHPGNPAMFQVAINRDSSVLYLTCTMSRVKDNWKLTKIHQDSVDRKF